ncbi:hypothetical protein M0Q97_11165 [Candidatus Dojkabacteria bacterium]|jgi:hypothetical protein|nr:hypothetical protein [Candidatus Dojkabacteria bacterium]
MKICRLCGKEKDISEFHKKTSAKDGHRNECKECVKIIQLKYKDIDKRKKYDKLRYDENKDKILKNKKEYYKKNKKIITEKKKIYNSQKHVKENQRLWRINYLKYNKDIIYKYRKNNPL